VCTGYESIFETTGTVSFSQSVDLTGVPSLTVNWYHYGYLNPSEGSYLRIYVDDEIIYNAEADSADYPEILDIPIDFSGSCLLRIETHCGSTSCYDTSLWEISALGPDVPLAPIAAFAGFPTSGTDPLLVLFTDESTNTPTSWLWSFGDAIFSIEQNPFHTYAESGVYTVSLKATNAGGNSTEIKVGYITVLWATPSFAPMWTIDISPSVL